MPCLVRAMKALIDKLKCVLCQSFASNAIVLIYVRMLEICVLLYVVVWVDLAEGNKKKLIRIIIQFSI